MFVKLYAHNYQHASINIIYIKKYYTSMTQPPFRLIKVADKH